MKKEKERETRSHVSLFVEIYADVLSASTPLHFFYGGSPYIFCCTFINHRTILGFIVIILYNYGLYLRREDP